MPMRPDELLQAYFAGEKAEAFWILAAGLAALAGAAVLWFGAREPFARGLAVALLVVAALGVTVGGTVYFRSEAQARELLALQAADGARFAAEEGPRIGKVVASFGLYRYGYTAAVLLALGLAMLGGRPAHHGLAVGLLLLAALGFTIDFYAERRALEYQRGLVEHGWIREP